MVVPEKQQVWCCLLHWDVSSYARTFLLFSLPPSSPLVTLQVGFKPGVPHCSPNIIQHHLQHLDTRAQELSSSCSKAGFSATLIKAPSTYNQLDTDLRF